MKYFIRFLPVIVMFIMLSSCSSTSGIDYNSIKVADNDASIQTKKLYLRISEISKKGIAFGHQDATAYGIGWKNEDGSSGLRSDIKEVAGDFPAVHGFDIGHIELEKSINLDTVSFALMKNHIKQLNAQGAIITMSWHLDNPVTNGDSWDTTTVVPAILKGGTHREKYELWIKRLSVFLNSIRDKENNVIPVIFRPYHEMNGSWFWWGANHCNPAEYKQLWVETQQLLKENGVHNLLYAYSPNTLGSEEDFDTYYPGDAYVDILGVDIYNHGGNEEFTQNVKYNLEILKKKAGINNKPYALSESGNVNFGLDANWWTQTLYPGIKDSGIAWVLFWRNANPSHYFSTYKGEISEEDFIEFSQMDEILFLEEIKNITN